jgi:tRNA threonylcarbamoyladenosine biosynthesis protein TsaB
VLKCWGTDLKSAPAGVCFVKATRCNRAAAGHHAFLAQHFEDVAYFEPFYLKDFVAGIPKVKGLH